MRKSRWAGAAWVACVLRAVAASQILVSSALAVDHTKVPLPYAPEERPVVLPRGWGEASLGWERLGANWQLLVGAEVGLPICAIGARAGIVDEDELGWSPIDLRLMCRVFDREPPRTSIGVGAFGRMDPFGLEHRAWSGASIAIRQQLGPTAWTWRMEGGAWFEEEGAVGFGARGTLEAVLHLGPIAVTGATQLTSPSLGPRLGGPPLTWRLGVTFLFSRGLELSADGGACVEQLGAPCGPTAAVWLRVRG